MDLPIELKYRITVHGSMEQINETYALLGEVLPERRIGLDWSGRWIDGSRREGEQTYIFGFRYKEDRILFKLAKPAGLETGN